MSHRTSKCGMSINKQGAVTSKVSQSGKSVLHGGNIMSCGSVWTCPHCASRICSARKLELDQVLSWAREEGHSMYHVTYTLSHTKYDRLARTLEDLKRVRAKLFSGRWTTDFKNNHNYIGSVRVLEVTYSELNGWHPHFHEIIIFKNDFQLEGKEESKFSKPVDLLKDILFERYKNQADKIGISRLPTKKYGIKVTEANENGAFYFTKWGLSIEMTGRVLKSAKGGSLNPFEILNSNDEAMLKLGREYIKEMEGQRAIVLSNGLKIMAGIFAVDDRQLLINEEQSIEDWDCFTPHRIWQHIKMNKQLSMYEQLILFHKMNNKSFPPNWALDTARKMVIQGAISKFEDLEPVEIVKEFDDTYFVEGHLPF